MGIVSGLETRVNTYVSDNQTWQQATALTGGGWVVTWSSAGQDGSGYGIYQQAYNADGTARNGEVQVNTYVTGDQTSPEITALADGGWVVTWTSDGQDGSYSGVYQQAYNADGTARGGEMQVNKSTLGSQSSPQITALNSGGWAVTWISVGGQAGCGVYQQAYHADGTALGGEVLVSTSATDQTLPQITALANGGWVDMWTSDSVLHLLPYNADGTARGGYIVSGSAGASDIAALADGGWEVTWSGLDGSDNGIYQVGYNADGGGRGLSVLVNTQIAGEQNLSQMAALVDGGWVVTWSSDGQDGSGYGIYQQAYSANGTARGGETKVNTYVNDHQWEQQITALSGGGWVVTWSSEGEDGSGYGIYQQAYNADGTARGGEVQVNTYVTGDQTSPEITALADGGWVVTWTSDGQDGSGKGVYQRVFHLEADAPTISGAHVVTTTSETAVKPFAGVAIDDSNPGGKETLTITLSDGGKGGTLSGAGLSGGTGGVYTLTGTAAQVTSALDALTFTPTAGQANTSTTTTFTLSDISSAFATATVDSATTVTDNDPPVAPTISGAYVVTTISEVAVKPFAGVTIIDANFDASETLTVTLSDGGAGGTLSSAGLSGGTNGVYTLSGSAADVTTALAALTFKPTAGQANTATTTTFTLSDVSSAFATATVDSTTKVTDIDLPAAPTISGAHQVTTTSEASVKPFAGVTIADPNADATDTLTITLSDGGAGGTLSGAGLAGGTGGVYTLTGSAAAVTSALSSLTFTPTAGQANTSTTTTFMLSNVSSAFATATVDSATKVTDTDPPVAPTIAGTHMVTTTSEAAVKPFAGVTIADANANATETLTITLSNGGAGGRLSGAGLGGGTGGVYTLTGSAAAVTGALDTLTFTPAAGQANTTTFTLSDRSSAFGTATVDGATKVIDIHPVKSVHANDISRSGDVTGAYNFIDLLNLQASYGDLVKAFGPNTQAMQNWFNTSQASEHRADTFDGLDYIASYGDLVNAFKSAGSQKAVLDAGAAHYINAGSKEGRTTTFNGLDYIASYGDLINAFGANGDAGAYHYIESGASEGRSTTFDGLDYIASYTDLIKAFGANEQAGAAHFINSGSQEGRKTTFDGLAYIASNADLMNAFGADNDAGATHYISNGLSERRSTGFDVAAYESAHPDLIGQYASNDAFLTAYINTYKATGTYLT
jgi:hypothetical protein